MHRDIQCEATDNVLLCIKCSITFLLLLLLHCICIHHLLTSWWHCIVQTLRRTLDSRGYQHVGIIAADQLPSGAWTIADDILRDAELFAAVDIVGLVSPLLKLPLPLLLLLFLLFLMETRVLTWWAVTSAKVKVKVISLY